MRAAAPAVASTMTRPQAAVTPRTIPSPPASSASPATSGHRYAYLWMVTLKRRLSVLQWSLQTLTAARSRFSHCGPGSRLADYRGRSRAIPRCGRSSDCDPDDPVSRIGAASGCAVGRGRTHDQPPASSSHASVSWSRYFKATNPGSTVRRGSAGPDVERSCGLLHGGQHAVRNGMASSVT